MEINLGDNTVVEESDGEPVIRHTPSGATFHYDSANDTWGVTADFDLENNTIQNVDGLDATSVSTGELSNIRILDTNTTDNFGSQVQTLADELTNGGTILVPPAQYRYSTTATINNNVTIMSLGGAGADQRVTQPYIIGDADVPAIEGAENQTFRVYNLGFESTVTSPTEPAIRSRGLTLLDGIGVKDYENGVELVQETTNDNLNHSRVENIGGVQCSGDLVYLDNQGGGSTNLNAIIIDVRTSFQNGGYAVNMVNGFRNAIRVQHVEGSNHTGAIRVAGDDTDIELVYTESNINQGIVFDGDINYAHVVGSGLSYGSLFVDNVGNNKWDCPGIAAYHTVARDSEFTGATAGDYYLDDGTNTGDGSPHWRYYDGAAWNDL